MNRCNRTLFNAPAQAALTRRAAGKRVVGPLALACALLAGGVTPLLAQNQQRSLPPASQRALIEVISPPNILLNGQPERLSPGARIRDANNFLVTSNALGSRPQLVQFVREPGGLVREVWVLTPAEAAQAAVPYQSSTLANGSTRAAAVPRDDGKTPFNQLPKYPNQ